MYILKFCLENKLSRNNQVQNLIKLWINKKKLLFSQYLLNKIKKVFCTLKIKLKYRDPGNRLLRLMD